jgi:DNA invertase Pin-like site-specific DNA recombinase
MDISRRVAGYLRVSQARDGMRAPEIYRDEIERYCRYRELQLGEVFSDIDYSGYRGAKARPALEELKARRHEFSSVVVPKLARFGRSVRELVELFDLFDRDRIGLVFLDMNVDTSTSQGRLLRHMMAAFAEYESDVKADYARANHRMVRAQGRPWGGRPPFGYELDPAERSYLIHPERARIVREIFATYLAGGSQYGIARTLNARGLVRPSGAPWSDQQIGRVLDNPAYAGLCIVDGDYVSAVWQPIVERSLWDEVRTRRARDGRRQRQLRTAKGGPYLLTGMLYCGLCGRRILHRTRQARASGIYVCVRPGGKWCRAGSIDCERADRFVSERFLDRCQFGIEGRPDATFEENDRAWAKLSLPERRRLLAMTIRRVVLVPDDDSVAGSSRRKHLEIEWASGTRSDSDLAVVIRPVGPERARSSVSDGRVDMLRDMEVTNRRKAQERLSENAKAYYRDWNDLRARLRGQLSPR